MFNFIFWLFGHRGSRVIAKKRLQKILFHDRTNLPSNIMELMAADISNAISSYVDVDTSKISIKIAKRDFDGRSMSALEIVLPMHIGRELYPNNPRQSANVG